MGFWRRITDAIAAGQLYKTHDYYVYGPGSAIIFHYLDMLPSFGMSPLVSLRYKIAAMLTTADIAIAYLLWRRYSLRAAAFMLLNPISIIITGYHSNIDILYILLGLIAIGRIEKEPHKVPYAALILIGLSLIIKHGLILFPVWLAIKAVTERKISVAVASLCIPYMLFLLSFVPFCLEPGMLKSILERVFQYRGIWENGTFWTIIRAHTSPFQWGKYTIPDSWLAIATLILLGYHWRKRKPDDLFFLYAISLIVFSSARANQYFTVPCIAIAVYPNVFFILYSLLGGLYLAGDGDGLHIPWITHLTATTLGDKWAWYALLTKILFMGLVLMEIKNYWRNKHKLPKP